MANENKTLRIEFDASEFLDNLDLANEIVQQGARLGMHDSVDEVVRIASEITPIDKGTLQKAHAEEVKINSGSIEGIIEFSVKEAQKNGQHYDYALWIHEGDYNLGEQSLMSQGTSGWSGKTYPVGNKYLERPIKGEEDAIKEHIAKTIRNLLGD